VKLDKGLGEGALQWPKEGLWRERGGLEEGYFGREVYCMFLGTGKICVRVLLPARDPGRGFPGGPRL